MLPETLRWIGDGDGTLELLDQRLLPHQTVYMPCRTVEDVYVGIKDLAVRGAPAIGVAAAYGAFIAARSGADIDACLSDMRQGCWTLSESRPTAVNLNWALHRMQNAAQRLANETEERNELLTKLLEHARQIDREDRAMCRQIGVHGGQFIKNGDGVLTHCNAGSLATSFFGTALAVIYDAWEAGKRFKVYADETRPVGQGARLTYWELQQSGVDATLICDNMAGYAMQLGKINLVVVGADRIAANGDVANKIGTYSVAVLAKRHNIPFYVAAPASTFDLTLETGQGIPIEERSPDEVRKVGPTLLTCADAQVWNPAFDVTPAELVTALITDRGVIEKPTTEAIAAFFQR
jgi:methylthioribose-1-phosphate isomerase